MYGEGMTALAAGRGDKGFSSTTPLPAPIVGAGASGPRDASTGTLPAPTSRRKDHDYIRGVVCRSREANCLGMLPKFQPPRFLTCSVCHRCFFCVQPRCKE
jgi:hypothetical protein